MSRSPGHGRAAAGLQALPHLLRQATASLDGLLVQALEARGVAGVGASGLRVLLLVRRPKPVTQLAETLRMTPQAMGRVVRRMDGLGLVERYEDPYDARSLLVELTDDGADLAATVADALQDALDVVSDDLEGDRLERLVADLAALAEVGREPDPWRRW